MEKNINRIPKIIKFLKKSDNREALFNHIFTPNIGVQITIDSVFAQKDYYIPLWVKYHIPIVQNWYLNSDLNLIQVLRILDLIPPGNYEKIEDSVILNFINNNG